MTGDDEPPIDAPSNPDAYVPPSGYTRLIGRTWSLPVGARDIYRCVRVTVAQDTYITNIEAEAPLGTHHTVLSIASGTAAGPDGETDCSVGTLGMVMLYASGVGTSPLDFPSGVGVKIAAGQQIHLNLHLYNAGDTAISGESAIWVKAQPTPPPTLAEMVFVGPVGPGSMTIAPSTTNPPPQLVTETCPAVSSSYSVFAIWPHMHKLATHQKLVLTHNAQPTTLHDMPYSFYEQTYWLKDPIVQVAAGDNFTVTCSYDNTTGATVGWGDSSDEEMCFAGMYRYPARNSGLFECF